MLLPHCFHGPALMLPAKLQGYDHAAAALLARTCLDVALLPLRSYMSVTMLLPHCLQAHQTAVQRAPAVLRWMMAPSPCSTTLRLDHSMSHSQTSGPWSPESSLETHPQPPLLLTRPNRVCHRIALAMYCW
jgi:hypothetical protein